MLKKKIFVTRGHYSNAIEGVKDMVDFTRDASVRPDAIIVPGGSDVSPELYGHPNLKSWGCSKTDDYLDMCYITNAKLEKIPVIGICKGAQLLHVHNGGTLVQDIRGHTGTVSHAIEPTSGHEDRVPELFKNANIYVNSTHHQAVPVDEAVMYDGSFVSFDKQAVEAFFCKDRKVYGFQYHPEYPSCPESGIKLFAHFINNVIFN